MAYVALGHINADGKRVKRGDKLPSDVKKETIEYLLKKGAIVAVAPTGEIIDEDPEEPEEDSDVETEEEPEEESEEIEEESVEEAPEIDVMAGIIPPKKRGRRKA